MRNTNRTGLRHRRRITATAVVVAAATLVGLSGCSAPDTGIVTLNFFQFKPEAVTEFASIIDDFEAENPGIRVIQNSVPDPDTAIRTLLVKDKVPDVLTLNANGNYGELARACIFADLAATPVAATVNPAVQNIVQALGTCAADGGKEVNALPFASNASGILYNPTIFAQNGVTVPTTWTELVAAAEKFKANGVSPFFCTLKDAWTAAPAFVNLGGTLMPNGFFDALRAEGSNVSSGTVSFQKDFATAAQKEVTLFSYCQDNFASRDYNAGNKAFADGESAMYLQGSYAIPAIRANNPQASIGSFPYPVTDDADARVVVSGVDVGIAIGRDTAHPAEAQKFVDYLMSPAVVTGYSEAQSTFSPLANATPNTDTALAGLEPYFTAGKIVGFIDHQIPAAVPLVNLLQSLVISGDSGTFLSDLDSEWSKVAARTTTQRQGK
ncbi:MULTISPECIES: ABC transporter substrate-binding protein [unclassified Cryobacterium]|uniref:ABC transporter substrate-binding protein n=2 Tax=Bacteria TaxID=2 RepID=UPI001068D3F0|nr:MULTISPECIES: extracellular solute-binding protein [unclassified Cryobacterium]MEB0003241.1 extracellular solute-binding protein [Cryobacterium sp. RTC2.1]TFC02290.1 extracellular solute-binding protein [Cryobacterium sp. MDB2-33-2]TFC22185.1 extracellular solute-binding protein [Cryobacterium sp. MDB2-10]TFC30466.1 extracellular solute-binding protein [Cryobacterium sp. MDB1-18-2]TFC44416.1 extracellular solute-binding protein [Cryobacterium sp. MDB1-18-1]